MNLIKSSQILAQACVPNLLVSNLINIKYLTGLDASAGLLLVTNKALNFFLDSRYLESAKSIKGIKVKPIEQVKKALGNVKKCGFESEHVTCSRLKAWKKEFKNTKFVQTIGLVEELRRQKSPKEIAYFKKAQKITLDLLKKVPGKLKEGIAEKQLAWWLQTEARNLGADELAFEPIVAFGTNTSRPHHHPTDKKLRIGQLVQIDVGARYKGYCADKSRVFFTGKSKNLKQLEVYKAVAEAKKAAEAAVMPGVTNQSLDKIARSVLKKHGLEQYFVHALGHGVGLEIHEGVSISTKAKSQKLKPNEIITIEPGVYIPGKFGIRLEDEVIVGG